MFGARRFYFPSGLLHLASAEVTRISALPKATASYSVQRTLRLKARVFFGNEVDNDLGLSF